MQFGGRIRQAREAGNGAIRRPSAELWFMLISIDVVRSEKTMKVNQVREPGELCNYWHTMV